MILQQTSNYVLKKVKEKLSGKAKEISTPLGSLDYLDRMDQILASNSECAD